MTPEFPGKVNYRHRYSRIVSLSPSTTETLFALGLDDYVVGVTRFCNYPVEAKAKAKVGGYFDPNYEAVAALEPDLVIILPEHEMVKDYLAELGLNHFTVNNKTVSDIISAIGAIGRECGVGGRAREVMISIESRMNAVRRLTADLPRPSVLISIGRTIGSGSLRDVFVAGRNTYYDELIDCAGGRNAYDKEGMAYPMLSTEGIIHINPDIIIDLVPDLGSKGFDEHTVRKEWESVSRVEAIKNGRLYILSQDYAVIPGPRFIEFLEDMARIFHPGVEWDDR